MHFEIQNGQMADPANVFGPQKSALLRRWPRPVRADGRAVCGLAVRGTGVRLQLILDHELVIAYTTSPTKRRKGSFSAASPCRAPGRESYPISVTLSDWIAS